ncbi:PREDICTED: LOW QUALITY PROTEIN: cell division cycle protein 123 homolog [Erythranthe guttata]|uniref:LOW QUALITY PROTEIN: cell division cycle protein 123 homolog n=1 Tax=Erythranthe guttata TaxID=4155 RepID=UPI00064DB45F|nr:PREDICTED: LOW QUALITY PROTEIN: cell division cycle protein 123 homolog [Erythranthe guttata]|eukprot:XP_012838207.1 PREDICTED: LOW QUALITY PROTEIN: cell division cycle protein 123 homolog [Erythranthe guttata]
MLKPLTQDAPKDAAWISSIGNLKCKNISDIALLLKSSDSIVHNLCHAYDVCVYHKASSRPSNFFLALRKWYPSFQPEMEFRCFVLNKLLVGICQREVTNFHPTLVERKSHLKAMILDFFVEEVKGKFGSESFTFDVYVTKDGRVKVLDFNPWGGSTLTLMFSWDELEDESREGDEFELDFRIVESRCGIRPGLKTAR